MKSMNADTKKQFEIYMAELQAANGGQDATASFSVSPSVSQTISNRVQESSDFLQRINIQQVDEPEDEVLHLGVSRPIAQRSIGDRETSDVVDMVANRYACKQTNFDIHLQYSKMDAWAKLGNLKGRINTMRFREIALNRIRIGFNGVSADATTNRWANPDLEDVNVGWLQCIRDNSPSMVFSESSAGLGHISIGMTGDYGDLNALIYDAGRNILPPWHRDDKDIVCLMSMSSQKARFFPYLNAHSTDTDGNYAGPQAASEQVATDALLSVNRIDGRPIYTVPFFPEGTILLTSFDNLSIYEQRGTHRRRIVDNPKRNRVETYESLNEAYVVEDLTRAVLIENITLGY